MTVDAVRDVSSGSGVDSTESSDRTENLFWDALGFTNASEDRAGAVIEDFLSVDWATEREPKDVE